MSSLHTLERMRFLKKNGESGSSHPSKKVITSSGLNTGYEYHGVDMDFMIPVTPSTAGERNMEKIKIITRMEAMGA